MKSVDVTQESCRCCRTIDKRAEERECCTLLAAGSSDKIIAESVGISSHTVRCYIDGAAIKMNAVMAICGIVGEEANDAA